MTERQLILGIRFAALLFVVVVIPMMGHVMMVLPWQVDCAIALIACVLFAYKFERGEER